MNGEAQETKVVYIRLDDIIPNRFQPREIFDETGLEELAESIKEHGVIQPIIVRQIGDKYELIAGERRVKASAIAGLTTIPAIIRNMDDRESAKVSLLENLQRKNLSAIEEARTYKRILELDNMSQSDLARTMGRSQPLIANKLRLLSLPEEVQDALMKNQISERHARSLLNVKDKRDQLNFLDRIRNERLTVRELDALIKDFNQERSVKEMNPNPINNARSHFGGMGLNDYPSSVNNNIYTAPPQNFDNIPNPMAATTYNSDYQNIQQNDEFSANSYINTPLPTTSRYDSLGSMFDGNSPIQNKQEPDFGNDIKANNIFISHIKEDNERPPENQFLPNFTDLPQPNASYVNDNSGYSSQELPSLNNDSLSTMQPPYDFSSPMNSIENIETNTYKNTESIIPNHQREYFNDFGASENIESRENQGELFNQPLNFVDIPAPPDFKETQLPDLNQNQTASTIENQPFDNPFDDPYESILYANPVPIQPDLTEENMSSISKEEVPEIEVIGNEDVLESKPIESRESYIKLEPEKTIHGVHSAVLEVKKATDHIKENGLAIETEEIDFDDYYQIVIKIKKEQ